MHIKEITLMGLTITWSMDIKSGGARDDGVLGWNPPVTTQNCN